MITLIHNPRCGKSRQALKYLESNELNPSVRLYLSDPLTLSELRIINSKLKNEFDTLIRKNEKTYKDDYKDKSLSNEEWLKVLAKEPKLLQRPIILTENEAIVARSEETLVEFIKNYKG